MTEERGERVADAAMCALRGCTFGYAGAAVRALRDVDAHARRGEFVVLAGRSGCGKTTVTRLLNGLAPVHVAGALEGEARTAGLVAGRADIGAYARVVGSVFQNPKTQYFQACSTDELAFACENAGVACDEIRARIARAARRFRIEDLLDRTIAELSGGQQQRLAVAAATMLDPDVLVLDEPTSNLDADAMHALHDMLAALKRDGVTVVVAEHRLAWCADLVDRYIVLDDGACVGDYDAQTFRALPAQRLRQWGLRALDVGGASAQVRRKIEETRTRRMAAMGDADGTPVLSVRGLRVGYRARSLFGWKRTPTFAREEPDLDFHAGRIVGLVGRNGAGKSTFARTICGLQRALGGTIAVDGRTATRDELSRAAGMVMQDVHYQLFSDSVRGELMLDGGRARCDTILDDLGLLDDADRHPMSLSGGERQRLAIGTALIANKRFIVLDEPTSGLDHGNMMRVGALLRSLADRGVAVIVITHDDELAAQWCDELVEFT